MRKRQRKKNLKRVLDSMGIKRQPAAKASITWISIDEAFVQGRGFGKICGFYYKLPKSEPYGIKITECWRV